MSNLVCIQFLLILILLTKMTDAKTSVSADKTRLIGRIPKPLPIPLRSNIPGTWAHSTMSKRIIDDIFNRIIEDNTDELTQPTSKLRAECWLVLNDLKSSLECGSEGYLRGIYDEGPDKKEWDEILNAVPDSERNWLDSPWVVSEFYFYRRIIEAFKFFETGYDMFLKQKAAGLISSLKQINEVALRLPLLLSNKDDIEKDVKLLILNSLWGNKADLSIWPALKQSGDESTQTTSSNPNMFADSMSYILDNHIDKVYKILTKSEFQNGKNTISIVVDNAGYELVTDMILGYGLVELGIADRVVFHTKGHPTFVSDATTHDCRETINYLADEKICSFPAINHFAKNMQSMVESGKLQFSDDVFWCQPTPFWDMSDKIIEKLSSSSIVFVKGDANYRRLIGERDWPLDTKASDILSYWPVNVCALRTFKSENGCGITQSMQNKAKSNDKDWMVSGKWGVIQVGGPNIE